MSKVKIVYGAGHTRRYNKSIVADFLVTSSDDVDKVTKIHSDINLLLRQKNVHKSIGIENLRDYVEHLQMSEPEKHNFTDDELFSMIEPKSINNLTTMFEYARYIQDRSEKIKEKYDELIKAKKSYLENINKKSD